MLDFVTIDFETANEFRDSPCEIGLTFVANSKIQETKSWLIKPKYDWFNPFNIYIHGISESDVKKSPTFDVLWQELAPLLDGKFLIAHNAGFDMGVLRRTLDAYNIPYPNLNYSCSYIFSKKVWGGLSSYNLLSLCHINSIPLPSHRAGADSLACANLSLKAFEEVGLKTFEDFPSILQTTVGKIFPGGYKPSETKSVWNDKLKDIKGDSAKANPESIFYGRTVVFTGTLSSMTRAQAFQIIADIGGIPSNNLTNNTDFLVVGQQDFKKVGDGLSNKQEKAIKMLDQGVPIEVISEDDFLRNV